MSKLMSVVQMLAAAQAEGYITRNSKEWNETKFEGGELVVSDTTGCKGTVSEVREGRPWKIDITCLAEGCGTVRNIKVQDFFQVTSCSEKCKKALRNAGLKITATSNPSAHPRTKNPVKLLEKAFGEGAISKEEYESLLPAAQKQVAEREVQLKAEAEKRAKDQKAAALRKQIEQLEAKTAAKEDGAEA